MTTAIVVISKSYVRVPRGRHPRCRARSATSAGARRHVQVGGAPGLSEAHSARRKRARSHESNCSLAQAIRNCQVEGCWPYRQRTRRTSRWTTARHGCQLLRAMSAGNAGPTKQLTCFDCGLLSPHIETNYTLISSKHGWRLVRRISEQGHSIIEWRCPKCWALRKSQHPATR